MNIAKCGLMMALFWLPFPGSGDVFKYVDEDGKVYFTDAPLQGRDYRLEWKRESKKIIKENSKRLIAVGRKKNCLRDVAGTFQLHLEISLSDAAVMSI